MWTRAGQMNAPVFPLPVLAIRIISRPLNALGIAWKYNIRNQDSEERIVTWDWIGVGVVNSDLRSVFINRSSKPKWAKLTTGRGIFTPRTYDK